MRKPDSSSHEENALRKNVADLIATTCLISRKSKVFDYSMLNVLKILSIVNYYGLPRKTTLN